MIVELKKAKITKSVLKQSSISFFELKKGEILGWVIDENRKWIVSIKNGIITKFPFFDGIEKIVENNKEIKLRVNIGKFHPYYYLIDTQEEYLKYASEFTRIKTEATALGQFYI